MPISSFLTPFGYGPDHPSPASLLDTSAIMMQIQIGYFLTLQEYTPLTNVVYAEVSEVILLNMNTDPIAGVVVKQRQEIPAILNRVSDIHRFTHVILVELRYK